MINEPFEPVSEPRAMGWPHHGIVATRRVGGVAENIWIAGGVERAFPTEMYNIPYETYVSHKVCHPAVKQLDLTADEVASEYANGREWWEFATIAGSSSLFYGSNLGVRAWVAVLDDGKAWKVVIDPEFTGVRYRWMMRFSRTSLGPAIAFTGLPVTRQFSVELAPESATSLLLSPSSAQLVLSGNGNHGNISDVSRNGTRVIMDGAILRVVSAADLTAHGLDIATVTGELPFVFNAILHGKELKTNTTSSYGRFREESDMVLQRYDLDSAAVATMPYNESYSPLPSGAVSPTSSVRVNSIDPLASAMWIDYHLYDVPPRTEKHTWETKIKAHLSEDADSEIVTFRVLTEITAVQTYTGQACAWSAFYSSGAIYPDFARCPPPSLASVSTTYTLKQIIEYGNEQYVGERVWTATEAASGVTVSDCVPIPAASYTTGNYTTLGAVIVPQAYAAEGYVFRRGRPAPPITITPETWWAVFPPPFPVQPGATNQEIPSVWNRNSFSMREPVVDDVHMIYSQAQPFPPIVARYGITTNYFENSMPAAANMPKGLYYKGKFITPWLPAYNDVWTMNPKTYEVHVFPRAPAYDADGYLSAIYI